MRHGAGRDGRWAGGCWLPCEHAAEAVLRCWHALRCRYCASSLCVVDPALLVTLALLSAAGTGSGFYGPDGAYPFAGKECARALARFSTEAAGAPGCAGCMLQAHAGSCCVPGRMQPSPASLVLCTMHLLHLPAHKHTTTLSMPCRPADCCDDLSGLSLAELDSLREWQGRLCSKYPVVGEVVKVAAAAAAAK